MKTIDGKALAEQIKTRVKNDIAEIGKTPNFVAVIVGDNPASKIYISKKQRACEEVGINMKVVYLGAEISQGALNDVIAGLSADNDVHAILLQLPLPNGLEAREAISYISPAKDVDGLTAENFGKLASGELGLVPCTALGIMHILDKNNIDLNGKDVCVIGRSNIVGKPVALLMCARNATVTLCHSKTKDLEKHTGSADVIVVAVGQPQLLRGDMIKQGAVVIDVGVNRLENGSICGDVDFEAVSQKTFLITPVPNGVGPLTIAFLLSNILQAFGGVKNVRRIY